MISGTKYNFFTDKQFGFREQHSTNLALTFLYEYVRKQRDDDNSVCGIFMDFAKAFDSVNHEILLSKLEHYGVRRNATRLLKSYLTNRMQYSESDEQTSKMSPITIEVPQGGVLEPFLFLVFMTCPIFVIQSYCFMLMMLFCNARTKLTMD